MLVFRPRKRHHNKTFTCSASNIADRSRRQVRRSHFVSDMMLLLCTVQVNTQAVHSCVPLLTVPLLQVSLLLRVRYAPWVQLTASRSGAGEEAEEGDTLQFRCAAHANPHPSHYSWWVDGQRASGFDSDYFIITNISQSYHNSIVKCEVRNEIGKSEETETIQVRCK